MDAPKLLPSRSVRLDTSDPDALAEAQPERRRHYQWLSRGAFRATLAEESVGGAAILRERWSCGMRVSCDRSPGYRAFTLPLELTGDVIWCGATLARGSVLRVDEPWEISTSGRFEYIAFAVNAAALEEVEDQLSESGCRRGRSGNAVLAMGRTEALNRRLRSRLAALGEARPHSAAADLAAEDLLHLAAKLSAAPPSGKVERVSPPSRRRAAVRRIESYLEAHRGDLPSIPTLCSIAGVGERTLEYAFREQVGTTPVRYLKIRRLNGVRRELSAREVGPRDVATAAHRWGFLELGRFAGEYRSLFGELPSETLRRASPERARELDRPGEEARPA